MLFCLPVRVIALGNDYVGLENSYFLTEITATILVHFARLVFLSSSFSIGAALRCSKMDEEFLY